MASSYETFKDLELTRDEVERITDALKNKEFRKLLTEYVEEVRNPDNQKIYQQEITQLEKERGIDITFLNPNPGYVIKTSADGSKKAFINICSNEHVAKPTSRPEVHEGSKGLQWSLPHSLTPPREDVDNKGDRCVVYDAVFHPDTLHLASKSKAFREMVNRMACNAVESNFNVVLDKKNLKFPKLLYKGFPCAAVVRRTSNKAPPELAPEEKAMMDKLFAHVGTSTTDYTKPKKVKRTDDTTPYTTPQYVIKHRRSYELQEFTEHKTAKINTAIPNELLVEIALPLLKSSTDIVLDVAEKSLQLVSEKPAKYKLSLTLPYCVNQDNGNAKFDKDKKRLVITLPVRNRTLVLSEKDDSGVDSDQGSPLVEMQTLTNELEHFTFLEPTFQYLIPDFAAFINEQQTIIVFTLNVKNVSDASVNKIVNESDFRLKFSSVSAGFYHVYYALYVKLRCVIDSFEVDVWDNNLTVQINYKRNNDSLTFHYGLDETSLVEKQFTRRDINDPPESPVIVSTPIDIVATTSESSSSDEVCYSLSPCKSRGILKFMRTARRSVSESGLDDVKWAASLLDNCTSVESVIPEEGEVSSSFKKTVRFNDIVSRKLFRSNSSIVGQRKKNQRKAKAKKRAQERRHSESELSETEKKKEGDAKTNNTNSNEKNNEDSSLESNLASEIFEIDIN